MCSSPRIHYGAKIKQQQNERGGKGNRKKGIDSAPIVLSLAEFGLLLYDVKWPDLFSMRRNPISQASQYNSPRLFPRPASSIGSFQNQQKRHLSKV